MLRLLIIIAVVLLIDIYAFQAFRTVIKSKVLVSIIYWFATVGVYAWFIYGLNIVRSHGHMGPIITSFFAVMVLTYVSKIVISVPLLLEDVYRLGKYVSTLFTTEPVEMESRRKFVSQTALILAAIPFTSVLYGITKGKYNYRVRRETLYFDDLPDAFDGFTLTQISDIHSGSFDNKEKVNYGIDLVNEQQSDMIVFTGDLVNNVADEMDPWKESFAKLSAKHGVYSILGNHDYGDYGNLTDAEKVTNFKKLKDTHKEIGFRLLLDEHVPIEKDGEKISLIGVENWGIGFHQHGDLEKAIKNVDHKDFKILLSHDPSHWEEQVKTHDKHIHLTLSGHTHGMQFGIEIPGIKWSPVKYRYPRWAGLYEESKKYIYINRGFGYLAFPGRVGIWPEITVIELRKA